MEWTDEGIVLSARKHGESSVIAQLLTGRRGRHAGLVRGGAGRRIRGVLQPGNQVSASWRARLAEHLGTMTVEPVRARAADLLSDSDRLAGLSAACAVAEAVLPERQPHRGAYEGMLALLDEIERSESWPLVYVRWEAGLLAELGFGLDLASCARTGAETGLAYVLPPKRARRRRGGGRGVPRPSAAPAGVPRRGRTGRRPRHARHAGKSARRGRRRAGVDGTFPGASRPRRPERRASPRQGTTGRTIFPPKHKIW